MMDQRFITSPYEPVSGLGQVILSSDISDWGLSQWAVVLLGGYLAVKLVADTKAVSGRVISHTKQTRRKLSKKVQSGTSAIGKVVTIGALAAAGVVGYELYTSQTSQAGTQ